MNLFDASKIANSSIVVKDNGKTIIMPLVTSGNGNTNTSTKLNVLCPDLQVGDVIYIRFKRNLNNNRNKFIYLYGSNRVLYASENSPSYTITQEDLNSYVFLYGNDYDYGETQQIIITDFKIQKNKITPYSPYNQGTVTIKQRGTTENNDYTIQTEPLRSLPNGVKDTIEVDGIHRRVGVQIFDGTENWGLSGLSTNNQYFLDISDIKQIGAGENDPVLISNYLPYLKGVTGYSNNNVNGISGWDSKQIRISLDISIVNRNINNFKTWLSNHNVFVQYPLDQEIIEPLTQNQATTMLDIIKTGSYEGTTNIYTDEDVKPTIKVDYYKKS